MSSPRRFQGSLVASGDRHARAFGRERLRAREPYPFDAP
jgi:hypothetical protein